MTGVLCYRCAKEDRDAKAWAAYVQREAWRTGFAPFFGVDLLGAYGLWKTSPALARTLTLGDIEHALGSCPWRAS